MRRLRRELLLLREFTRLACRVVELVLFDPSAVDLTVAPQWFRARNSPAPSQGRAVSVGEGGPVARSSRLLWRTPQASRTL